MVGITDRQLDLFDTLLKTPFRIISANDIKVYAEAVKACTGDLMLIRPIPGAMSKYQVILPY